MVRLVELATDAASEGMEERRGRFLRPGRLVERFLRTYSGGTFGAEELAPLEVAYGVWFGRGGRSAATPSDESEPLENPSCLMRGEIGAIEARDEAQHLLWRKATAVNDDVMLLDRVR